MYDCVRSLFFLPDEGADQSAAATIHCAEMAKQYDLHIFPRFLKRYLEVLHSSRIIKRLIYRNRGRTGMR